MQDWDRWVMVGVGVLVSGYTVYQAWPLWRKRKYLALAGVGVLVLAAIATPLALMLLSA